MPSSKKRPLKDITKSDSEKISKIKNRPSKDSPSPEPLGFPLSKKSTENQP